MRISSLPLVVLVALATACGGGDDGSNSSSSGGGACNALSLDGVAPAVGQYVAGDAPDMSGGAVRNGTYVAEYGTRYTHAGGQTGAAGGTYREKLTLNDGLYSSIVEEPNAEPTTSTGTYSTAGAVLTVISTCGDMGTVRWAYTADATHIWLSDGEANPFIWVYTKQ